MELKEAKCPNCGGLLKLNPELEKGTCIYCGTEFVVSEAIQKFQGEVSGIATTKSSLIRAQNSIEDGDYDEAMKILKHVIDTEPTNPDAYYEMFLCSLDVAEYYKRQHEGQERTLPQYIDDLHDALQKYGRRAVQYARDENEKAKFQQGIMIWKIKSVLVSRHFRKDLRSVAVMSPQLSMVLMTVQRYGHLEDIEITLLTGHGMEECSLEHTMR